MNGLVDDSGRTLLQVEIRAESLSLPMAVEVWIDTGFTGDLVLPKSIINSISLRLSGSVDAILADGSEIELSTYTCIVDWFGTQRDLEVVANDGDYPLLGVGMLAGLELRVNYLSRELKLNLP